MNDCGPSSQCKTKKCKCKEKNLDCKPNCQLCKCNINKCSNKNNENKNEILSKNDIAALITKEIRLSVTNKKDQVFSYRNNLDIYTNKEKDHIQNPQVDHIVEDQIVGHAAAYILKNESFVPYLKGLEECLNLKSLENYNVTFSEINGSKGAIIKSYLRDNLNKGYPLRALIKPESHFGKNMEPIFQAMNNTHNIVEEYLHDCKRSDNNISGNIRFEEIADQVAQLFKEMDLELNDNRKLRNNLR